MPSYIEDLEADPVRLRRAYEGLVREQDAIVARLAADLAQAAEVVDRVVLRLHIYTNQFGRGAPDTVAAQREAEDSNTLMVELRRKLDRQQSVLNLYRSRLRDLDGGPAAAGPTWTMPGSGRELPPRTESAEAAV
jgi:uncharacterized coiled-coil protein SlyX